MYGRDHMSGGSHEKCVGGGSADVASASRAESRRPSLVSPDNVSPVLRREEEEDCDVRRRIDEAARERCSCEYWTRASGVKLIAIESLLRK